MTLPNSYGDRSFEMFKNTAIMNWPKHIIHEETTLSVQPLLAETHNSFCTVLESINHIPIRSFIDSDQDLYGNLFLKHLMILSDLGGEALNKLPPLSQYIPTKTLNFFWNGKNWSYPLKEIGDKCALANAALKVDNKNLFNKHELDGKIEDVCMLILFGSRLIDADLPEDILEKCNIGEYVGQPDKLESFLKSRYLTVSKQTSGAKSNARGQLIQKFVASELKKYLPNNWAVESDSSLPGVTFANKQINFDIVVISPRGVYFGVEVSFQVTTNSVIERKSRESFKLHETINSKGHYFCHVLDGVGNLEIRKNASKQIFLNSDICVSLGENELFNLATFMLVQDEK